MRTALFAHEKEIKFGFEVLLSACCFYDGGMRVKVRLQKKLESDDHTIL